MNQRVLSIALAAALSVPIVGCSGGGFDPASKIKGLRVLAVQKEVASVTSDKGLADAYGVPGQPIQLKMLYVDQKSTPDNPRPIQIAWFGDQWPFQCFNPPADAYSG